MENNPLRLVKEFNDEENFEFKKYSSLINILKDQEEFWLDQSGVIISSNLEAVNITGYEEYEILGKHISFFYLPNERSKAEADLQKAKNLGQCHVTGARVKKRGTIFWARMKITWLDSTQPGSPRFKVVMRDATHRALSNLRVRTIKDEYLAIFNNPFVGTFKFRMNDYQVLMCNQKTLEIVRKTISGNVQFDSFFNSRQQFDLFISMLKQQRRVEGFKFIVNEIAQDNWAVVGARYYESRGYAEGVIIDISEQHSQMLDLQRVNTELDNFVYHASHSLRSPITTIQGLAKLGIKETSKTDASTYFEMIDNTAMTLDRLLRDLTSVSDNNTIDPTYELFDFKKEVELIVGDEKCFSRQVHFEIDIKQTVPFITDRVKIKTVISNLLTNAFNYLDAGKKRPLVKLKIRVNKTHASIHIADNGIGVEWATKGRIFDMFFRGSTKSTGSGLGLYIVKAIITKLGGTISFESTLNSGTTFLVIIPNMRMEISQLYDHTPTTIK